MRRRVLFLIALVVVAITVWLLLRPPGEDAAPSVTTAADPREAALATRLDPTLVGQAPPLPSDRAFPDLPPQEVPEGAGVIEPGERDLCGIVVDAYGEPVVGAWLRAGASDARRDWASAGTSRGGVFWLRLEETPERVDVLVGPPSGTTALLPRRFEDIEPGRHDLVLELDYGEIVEGAVVDEHGEPVEDAVVRVVTDDEAGSRVPGGRADARRDGSFRIVVETGTCRLRATSHSIPLRWAPSRAVEVEAPSTGVRLVCRNTVRIRGRVSPCTGEAFDVCCCWRSAGGTADFARDDAERDGTFEIAGVPPERVTLVAKREGDPRCAVLEIDAAKTRDVVLRLEEGLVISGHVRDTGLCTLEAWHVDLMIYTWCETDERGAFRLTGLVPGRYRLRLSLSVSQTYDVPMDPVEAGSTDVEVSLR